MFGTGDAGGTRGPIPLKISKGFFSRKFCESFSFFSPKNRASPLVTQLEGVEMPNLNVGELRWRTRHIPRQL